MPTPPHDVTPSDSAASAAQLAPAIGVYIHFPWCLRKCPYCDFASFERRLEDIDHQGYAHAIIAELAHRSDALSGRRLRSVFFGGGTPSLWAPAAVREVLAAVLAAADSGPEVEITLECNPSSLDEARAAAYCDAGINRLSVGVQGLDSPRLQQLGRLHDPDEALLAVRAALVSGAPQVSADLMYGVATSAQPGGWQSPQQAADEARRVAATGVGHLSCYALTIEPNTRFGDLARRGRLPQVSEAVMAESFLALDETLAEAGMSRYEISNWSRPGAQSQHNLGYWRGEDYLGLGCAAFGTVSGSDGSAFRYRNAPNPERYLNKVRGGDFSPHEREALSPQTRLRERIMLGLRLAEGLDLAKEATSLGLIGWTRARRRSADQLQQRGRLLLEGNRLRIPRSAWLFADGTAAALF